MLPSHKKDKLSKHKQAAFDKGRRLSLDKGKKKDSSKRMKTIIQIVFRAFILIAVILAGAFALSSFIKYRNYQESLKKVVLELDPDCKKYNHNDELNSFLQVTLDQNKSLSKADFFIYNKEKIVDMDFTDVEFFIDQGVTKGTLKRYVELNNLYLDDSKVFKNMANLFLREFYLKVDHIVVNYSSYTISDYSFDRKSINSIILNDASSFTNKIQTDVCRDSWNSFVEDYLTDGRNKRSIRFNPDETKISDLFNFSDLRKEQARIHLNNSTGVASWGSFLETYFENYGLNVVKNDFSPTISQKSRIYVDDEKFQNSKTLNQITYLIENVSSDYELGKKESIFADIYIDVGVDLLVR